MAKRRQVKRIELSIESTAVTLLEELYNEILELKRQSAADRHIMFSLLKRSRGKKGHVGGRSVTQADLDACIRGAEGKPN